MVIKAHKYADGGEVKRRSFRKGPPGGRSKKKKGVVGRTVEAQSGSLRERQMKELGL